MPRTVQRILLSTKQMNDPTGAVAQHDMSIHTVKAQLLNLQCSGLSRHLLQICSIESLGSTHGQTTPIMMQ